MAAVWGNNIKVTIFGESHGVGLGVVLDGLPAGLEIDIEMIATDMKRRAPGQYAWSTTRKEADMPIIQSGVYRGRTSGAPLTALIQNNDQHSNAYADLIGKIRPGHADWSSHIRYGGYNDPRGSGHFSGRITAGLVFAGSIAKQYLKLLNIECGAWISGIGCVQPADKYPVEISASWLNDIKKKDFPTYDEDLSQRMKCEIASALADGDSVGGTIGVAALGVPCGFGEPFFCSVESMFSSLIFAIPATKGVEFGLGFGMTSIHGSSANDAWYLDGDKIYTKTNNNGGINGGISNGMPILAQVAVKPTSTLAKSQKTVDYENNLEIQLSAGGRHDPCIVPRAVPVVESAMALTIFDLAVGMYGKKEVDRWGK